MCTRTENPISFNLVVALSMLSFDHECLSTECPTIGEMQRKNPTLLTVLNSEGPRMALRCQWDEISLSGHPPTWESRISDNDMVVILQVNFILVTLVHTCGRGGFDKASWKSPLVPEGLSTWKHHLCSCHGNLYLLGRFLHTNSLFRRMGSGEVLLFICFPRLLHELFSFSFSATHEGFFRNSGVGYLPFLYISTWGLLLTALHKRAADGMGLFRLLLFSLSRCPAFCQVVLVELCETYIACLFLAWSASEHLVTMPCWSSWRCLGNRDSVVVSWRSHAREMSV